MKKKKEIEVVKGFQSSVNISYDLNNYQKINNFIPITSSLEVIGEILLSTVPTSLQRSRMLIGAYGRGKSHIILVLASLLFKKEPSLFEGLLAEMKKKNPPLYDFTKNYLDGDEIKSLESIVSAYLDLAENRARRRIPMTMEDWARYLDRILQADDRELLKDAGSILTEIAHEHALCEFEKYRVIQDKLFESDFDKQIRLLEQAALGDDAERY